MCVLCPQLVTRNTVECGPLDYGVTGRVSFPLGHGKAVEGYRPHVLSMGRETTMCKTSTVHSSHSWESGKEGKGMAQQEGGDCCMHRLRNGTTLPMGTVK